MICCLRLICLAAAPNILLPFGVLRDWQQRSAAVGARGRTPARPRTPEQGKLSVICGSNKNNAVCIPRNFVKSQQIHGWHLQPVKQMYGLVWGVSAVREGEAAPHR